MPIYFCSNDKDNKDSDLFSTFVLRKDRNMAEEIILGIESSCDDTSAAVLRGETLLSNVMASQEVHRRYGGVVPELASRAHQQNIVPVVSQALDQAGVKPEQIDAIAYTRGPGLLGSLLVGVSFAKGLSLSTGKPLVDVNHLQGHILSHFIRQEDKPYTPPTFPFLALLVSGGHSQIVRVDGPLHFEVLGQGDPERFKFAKPHVPGLDYSFSGVKTSLLYFVRDRLKEDPDFMQHNMNDICASFQKTLIDVLMDKLLKAVKQTGIKHVAIGGGVSANSGLRNRIASEGEKRGWTTFIPEFKFTTDNAAMIAVAGLFKFRAGLTGGLDAAPVSRALDFK